FAEAPRTQQLEDWVMSHKRAFEFFGGVPQLVVPDVIYGNKCNTVGLKPTNEYRSYTNYCDKNLMIKCNEERYAYK
ncbi:hypothetical protein ACE1BJ_24745, partial [Aeromonas jandaei]